MMLQHSEAPFIVRKHITEKAKAFWKELKDVSVQAVLGTTAAKSKILDSNFEKVVDVTLGWKKGEQYEDQNLKITFNTFLLPDDRRLDSPNGSTSKKVPIPEAREEE